MESLLDQDFGDSRNIQSILDCCELSPHLSIPIVSSKCWEIMDKLIDATLKPDTSSQWRSNVLQLGALLVTCVKPREVYLMAVEKLYFHKTGFTLHFLLFMLSNALNGIDDIKMYSSGLES